MSTPAGMTVDVARVTIELLSPFTIGTGAPDDIVDSVYILDANGLPAIPGTSLAGILRDRWRAAGGSKATGASENDVFGSELRAAAVDGRKARKRSNLVVGWGCIHDSTNRPVTGLVTPDVIAADPVLRSAREPIVRQHVRIDGQGVADAAGRGLFDEAVVAAGHRFTFELIVENQPPAVMDFLLGLLASPATRLGGKSRRGMGRFAIAADGLLRGRFDLAREEDFRRYAALSADLAAPVPTESLQRGKVDPHLGGDTVMATVGLRPRGFWMMGGGPPLADGRDAGEARSGIDLLPYREPMVRWDGDRGAFDPAALRLVIPATGVKGALRHRTLFHARAQVGAFAGDEPQDAAMDAEAQSAVRSLFGDVDVTSGAGQRDGSQVAGRVMLEDVVLTDAPPDPVINHVSLDRFTSGPLDGHLFAEAPLWKLGKGEGDAGGQGDRSGEGDRAGQGDTAGEGRANGAAGHGRSDDSSLTLRLFVRDAANVPTLARTALAAALADLAEGRLQIGAGSGRGHGWFEGSIDWQPEMWPTAKDSEAEEVQG